MSPAEMTAIPNRKLLTDPSWLGLLTTLHVLPFQCSIRPCPIWAKDWPTAQMLLVETTAIPRRRSTDPGLGLVMTLHPVPFQCSISVWEELLLLEKLPTAQTSLAETAATLLRCLNVGDPDELAFASAVVRDRALSNRVTTHTSMAPLRRCFILVLLYCYLLVNRRMRESSCFHAQCYRK